MASPAHGPHTQIRSGNLPTEPLSSSGDGGHYKNPAHAHSRTIEDSRFRALTSGRAIFQFSVACTNMLAGSYLNRTTLSLDLYKYQSNLIRLTFHSYQDAQLPEMPETRLLR
jgi:hypothetical protein